MSDTTKAQLALLAKAASSPDATVFPFGGEWNAAYVLARRGLLAVQNKPGKSQHYLITDAGRAALAQAPGATP